MNNLLYEIMAEPNNDMPRLIYADWIEENGDPERAYFIRLQCHLYKMQNDDPQYKPTKLLMRKFLVENRARWLNETPGCYGPFVRGFLPVNSYLSTMDGWEVADRFQCHYSGDMNPVEHGGFFYNSTDWEKYKYAPIVEFWTHPETNECVVNTGTINKMDTKTGKNVHEEIENARYEFGVETDLDNQKSFDKNKDLSDLWEFAASEFYFLSSNDTKQEIMKHG